MNYYRGNAIYNYIAQNSLNNLKFVSGNMWQLVYGDGNCIPRVLVLVIGSTNESYDAVFSEDEKTAFNLLNDLAAKTNLPIRVIKFNTDDNDIEGVKIFNDLNSSASKISMEELTQEFSLLGVPTSNSQTRKYLNDRTSSAYHKWQRSSLGSAITVSDIDLWKVNEQKDVEIIYELKRSYIPINRWQPYRDDYRNFQLISKLAQMANIEFDIAYNVRHKNPFRDDISTIKVFSVDFAKNPPISLKQITSQDDFFNESKD